MAERRRSSCRHRSVEREARRGAGHVSFIWYRTRLTIPAKIGEFDTELVREFFHAVAMQAHLTLHVETLYGDNNHHIAEAAFKGLARALRTAIEIDPRKADAIPSTKGTL